MKQALVTHMADFTQTAEAWMEEMVPIEDNKIIRSTSMLTEAGTRVFLYSSGVPNENGPKWIFGLPHVAPAVESTAPLARTWHGEGKIPSGESHEVVIGNTLISQNFLKRFNLFLRIFFFYFIN